jgi:uncharacterized integral membrane protein
MAQPDDTPTTARGVSRPLVAALALGVLFLILAAQNSTRLHIHLLFWKVSAPTYGLVVTSALLGAAVAESGAAVWRHRRLVHDTERRELDRLRRKGRRPPPDPEPPKS